MDELETSFCVSIAKLCLTHTVNNAFCLSVCPVLSCLCSSHRIRTGFLKLKILAKLQWDLPKWCPNTGGVCKIGSFWSLDQEIVSGSGISWVMCKSAPCSRQITMPPPHHCYRPDALPANKPTASKHWRQKLYALPNGYIADDLEWTYYPKSP